MKADVKAEEGQELTALAVIAHDDADLKGLLRPEPGAASGLVFSS